MAKGWGKDQEWAAPGYLQKGGQDWTADYGKGKPGKEWTADYGKGYGAIGPPPPAYPQGKGNDAWETQEVRDARAFAAGVEWSKQQQQQPPPPPTPMQDGWGYGAQDYGQWPPQGKGKDGGGGSKGYQGYGQGYEQDYYGKGKGPGDSRYCGPVTEVQWGVTKDGKWDDSTSATSSRASVPQKCPRCAKKICTSIPNCRFKSRGKGCLFCHGHGNKSEIEMDLEAKSSLEEFKTEILGKGLDQIDKQFESLVKGDVDYDDAGASNSGQNPEDSPPEDRAEPKNCRHCGNRRCKFIIQPEEGLAHGEEPTCGFGDGCKFCHAVDGYCTLARRKSAREKRKQRLHVLMDFWAKRGIPPFIDALLKNAPPPEDDDFPDEAWQMLDKLNKIFATKAKLEEEDD